MEQRTIVDSCNVTAAGIVEVKMLKQIMNGGQVLHERIHRTAIEPGVDVDFVMAAVNEHLAASGFALVQDYAQLRAICAAAHTPEVVAAFRQHLAD